MQSNILSFSYLVLVATSAVFGTGSEKRDEAAVYAYVPEPGCRHISKYYPPHGRTSYSADGKEDKATGDWFFPEGTSVFIHCYSFFRPEGPTMAKCKREGNGTWSWDPKAKDMMDSCVLMTSSSKGTFSTVSFSPLLVAQEPNFLHILHSTFLYTYYRPWLPPLQGVSS